MKWWKVVSEVKWSAISHAIERLHYDDREGVMLGVVPGRDEMFVGTGPEDPDGHTWKLPEGGAYRLLQALAAAEMLAKATGGAGGEAT